MRNKCIFDIPIESENIEYHSMTQLMETYKTLKAVNPKVAESALVEAYKCGHLPAKFEYAKYLIHTPQLALSQAERYAKAERLLLELINLLDMTNEFVATVAMELARLYSDYLDRPVGALGYWLVAKQNGAKISDDELKRLQKKLARADINQMGVNPYDTYILGTGLLQEGGAFRMTEFFLREAVDQSALNPTMSQIHGSAALALADLYNSHRNESVFYMEESIRLYEEARKYNYPQYIRKPKKKPQTAYGYSKAI